MFQDFNNEQQSSTSCAKYILVLGPHQKKSFCLFTGEALYCDDEALNRTSRAEHCTMKQKLDVHCLLVLFAPWSGTMTNPLTSMGLKAKG